MELPTIDSESLVSEISITSRSIPSTPMHIHWGNLGEPSSKAKYRLQPIVNKYREGKVKRWAERPVK